MKPTGQFCCSRFWGMAVNEKKELLNELRIDRSEAAVAGTGNTAWLKLIVLGVVIGAVLVAAWYFLPTKNNEPLKLSTTLAQATKQAANADRGVLDATGYITARRQATVSSEITGKVVEVLVEEGQQVQQGELLARLDDELMQANLALAQARLQEARSNVAEVEVSIQEAEANLQRVVNLQKEQLASAQALDEARARSGTLKARLNSLQQSIQVAERSLQVQQEQLDNTLIRAPFDGVVINKAAQPGEMISPVSAGGGFTRTGICTLVDMNSLEIEVDVSESYINRVQAGQAVEAVLNSYADWRIPAEVITIIPAADRNRATVKVRIRLLVSDARILPDMGVKVTFLEDEIRSTDEVTELSGVFVPASAVWQQDEQSYVFVVTTEGVQRRSVRLGPLRNRRQNISAGLRVGDRIVTGLDAPLVAQLMANPHAVRAEP
jgi:RND family efflux transporter MFP subunit